LPGEAFLPSVLTRAGAEGGPGILVEAGPGLGRALIAEGLVDHAIVYTAGEGQGDPCAAPWLPDPLPLLDPETAYFGSDARISGDWKRA
jgi:riboflavin biosynthesis pyrimidine reductase